MREAGYLFHLIYLWLPTPEMAVERVAARVQAGGHSIPEPVVRRRYGRSLANFFNLLQTGCGFLADARQFRDA